MCSDSSGAVDLMKSGLFFHEYVGCMITESEGQENRRGGIVLKWPRCHRSCVTAFIDAEAEDGLLMARWLLEA